MGVLRFVLAIVIVCSHTRPLDRWPQFLLNGGAIFAVKAFFIVSGFYMAMVIDRTYSKLPTSHFYASRALRLLPLYWFISVATFAAEFSLVPRGQMFHPISSPIENGSGIQLFQLPIWILIYLAVSTLTMIGMDTGHWLGFGRTSGEIGVAPDFVPNATSVMALNGVPQGWSVGIEILFYAVAPFIVRRPLWVIGAFGLASLAFRFQLTHLGFAGQPWNRTLFGSELIYFIVGIFAYRLHERLPAGYLSPRFVRGLAFAVLVIALAYGPTFHVFGNSVLLDTCPYLLLAVGIPFLFKLTNRAPFDSALGDLSYPIYMCHVLVLGFVCWSPLNVQSIIGTGWPWLFLNLSLVIVVASLLARFVVSPVERLRLRFGARSKVQYDGSRILLESA